LDGGRAQFPLDAVVFLDSVVEYRPLDEFAAFKAALEQNRNSTAPVVMFADSSRQPHFEVFDPYLAYAARYEVGVDGMEHNDFVSQGAIGKNDGVHRKYEAICAVILRFLDAYLKAMHRPRQRYRTRGRRSAPTAIQGAAPAAYQRPNRKMYVSEGPSNMQALSALVKNADAGLLTDAADLLFDQGRSREGVGLLAWAVPILPKSALLCAALGEALAAMGDKPGSRSAFERALVLLPEDGTLDAGQKAQTRKAVEEGLTALRK
jgi:tetratricopeptide (TPR) repeat protein